MAVPRKIAVHRPFLETDASRARRDGRRRELLTGSRSLVDETYSPSPSTVSIGSRAITPPPTYNQLLPTPSPAYGDRRRL